MEPERLSDIAQKFHIRDVEVMRRFEVSRFQVLVWYTNGPVPPEVPAWMHRVGANRVLEKRARRGWFPEDYPLVRKAFAVAEERRQWRREDKERDEEIRRERGLVP